MEFYIFFEELYLRCIWVQNFFQNVQRAMEDMYQRVFSR